jgi:4-amino-4-deoxy-L-arabinose transferase-like glycosyltransferase
MATGIMRLLNREMIPLVRQQALLTLVAGLIFLTNLGGYSLFNDDEAKNTVCGTEMFRRGDVVVPTFYEELRTDKPILLYWIMLTSFKIFGISEFSARIGSALLSIGTTLLTYHLGRKLYSDKVGFLAGLILCTCLLFSAVGRAATPDPALIFCLTLAFTCYVWAVAHHRGGNFSGTYNAPLKNFEADTNPDPGKPKPADADDSSHQSISGLCVPVSWKMAAPFFVALGLAVLAKGPVGIVLPCAIIVLFLLITIRERDLANGRLKAPEGNRWKRSLIILRQLLRPGSIIEAANGMHLLAGIGIAAAVALPWYLTVGIQTKGAWLQGFLFDHNLGRALSPKENHDGFPFYQLYQLVALHFGCFPWSVFLPVAVYRMWERFRDEAPWRPSDLLLACWAGVWFIVFSLVSTRLPNYLLPMYPAAALILARYFHEWMHEDEGVGVYSFNLCCRAMGLVSILLVIGVYIAGFLLLGGEAWISLIWIIPIIAAFIAVKFLDREQRLRVMQTLIGMAVLLAFIVIGFAPLTVTKYQDTPKFIADARRIAKGADVEIGTYAYFQPTVLFYAGKKTPVLKSPREVADFMASHPHPYVITRPSELTELRNELTSDIVELSRHRNFLRRDELILIGRN